jgi:hypothetical protein
MTVYSIPRSRSNGSLGNTLIFGEFDAHAGRQYQLSINIVALPDFPIKDSAWLEVGVNRAAVSVGNEFSFGFFEAIASSLSEAILWTSVGMSLVTLLVWGKKNISRVNGG